MTHALHTFNPQGMAAPGGPYSQGALCRGPGEWLHLSGQVGVDENGEHTDDFEKQVARTWANVARVLEEGGMTMGHLVKTVTYVIPDQDLAAMNRVRLEYLGDARPASTLLVVHALAHPGWRIEVEAVAFKPA